MDCLVLIHTVSPLIEVFNKLCHRILPGVQVIQVLDEPLLKMIQQRGELARPDVTRLHAHVAIARKIGVRAVLVTCSTISPLVDKVRKISAVPLFKIDDAMIEEAVKKGEVIGVIATAPTTLEPTRRALERRAGKEKKKIETRMVLVEDALQSLLKGEGGLHDEKVSDAVYKLSKEVDVVVLAQASMARVLEVIPGSESTVPVLSSPHLALEQVKKLF